MIKAKSIWHTLEFDCITNGIGYSQYLSAHTGTNCPASPLTEQGYAALEQVFNVEVEDANKNAVSDEEPIIDPWDDFNG